MVSLFQDLLYLHCINLYTRTPKNSGLFQVTSVYCLYTHVIKHLYSADLKITTGHWPFSVQIAMQSGMRGRQFGRVQMVWAHATSFYPFEVMVNEYHYFNQKNPTSYAVYTCMPPAKLKGKSWSMNIIISTPTSYAVYTCMPPAKLKGKSWSMNIIISTKRIQLSYQRLAASSSICFLVKEDAAGIKPLYHGYTAIGPQGGMSSVVCR